MEIKALSDFASFTDIQSRCYPGMGLNTAEDKQKATEHREKMDQYDRISHIGVYEENNLVAGYIHYSIPMNVYGQTVPSAGLGTLAVDLPYKKKGIAKQMVTHVIEQAQNEGYPLVHLYPFRPDFYRKMGFGFGPQLSVYQFSPGQLPYFENVVTATRLENQQEIQRFYNEWAEETHGACNKDDYEFRHVAMEHTDAIGCRNNGRLEGYMIYQFKRETGDTFLRHDLHVTDWFTRTDEAFQSLINFLHNQKDQVRSIVFPTYDDSLAFLLDDPRNVTEDLIFRLYHETHKRGTGVMYRIVDLPLFMKYISEHSFGSETVTVHFDVEDTLTDTEPTTYSYRFEQGKPQMCDDLGDGVRVAIGIADLSSLLMGCVSLSTLSRYKRAEIKGSEGQAGQVKRLFDSPQKPENWSFF
ncbi:GNAT family N-acetyltransferase [Halobacillus amylolyticus]|uniref:GNAT family N-acetyltransferase n=1 Tax=Halobacillus amylolyticus TaxID=2932259 RepID=A0ABY4H8I0_9BACI|nr:GNAT family N-acetyltransferase [Halobacillus amylolyticus]UOR11169.1 GNAT family N-acetyltransferase [Halobacillus amylolyticus]